MGCSAAHPKQAGFFFFEKRRKKLLLTLASVSPDRLGPVSKGFLLLFFKKEVLPFLRRHAPWA
jgi:hypothetical protein